MAAAKKAALAAEREIEKQRQQKRKTAMYEDASAGKIRNVLQDFVPFCKFARNGVDLELTLTSPDSPDWTPELAAWVFNLTKENMAALYNATPGWEWKDGKKKAELTDSDGRYIIARQKPAEGAASGSGAPVAFVNFRFLLEDVRDVMYVWELQLTKEMQRKGLGKHLMQVCELVARKQGMQFVMLTVQKANESAVNFYAEKLKYGLDVTDPSMDGSEDAGYLIMSKCVNQQAYAEILAKTGQM